MNFDLSSLSRLQGSTYKCPVDLKKNFVFGSSTSDLQITTSLQVLLCDDSLTPEVTCKDESTISDTVNQLRLEFIYLNTNFDAQEVEKPLEGYLDPRLVSGLNTSLVRKTTVMLSENVGVTNDSRLGASQKQEEWLQFYQTSSIISSEFATRGKTIA